MIFTHYLLALPNKLTSKKCSEKKENKLFY